MGRCSEDPYSMGWRSSLARCGGGIVIDGGLHWLRPARILGGEIDSVIMTSSKPFTVDSPAMEGESLARALLRFKAPAGPAGPAGPSKAQVPVQGTFGATLLARTHMSQVRGTPTTL